MCELCHRCKGLMNKVFLIIAEDVLQLNVSKVTLMVRLQTKDRLIVKLAINCSVIKIMDINLKIPLRDALTVLGSRA